MPNEDIKGYQIDKGQYLEVTKDELDNIALESTRTIEIDEVCGISSAEPLSAGVLGKSAAVSQHLAHLPDDAARQ